MPKLKKPWVSWEEFWQIAGGNWAPSLHTHVASDVGGLTAGSIPFADAAGWLAQDNANFFWDAANIRLGIGTPTPDVPLDIEFPAVVSVVSRVSAKTRPWRHWECIDGNWGLAIGIDANDGIIHFNYDAPIGTMNTIMMVFDGPNVRVGILDSTPDYPLDIGGNTRVQGTFRATDATTLETTLAVTGATTLTGLLSNTGGAKLEIQGEVDGTSARGIFMWDTTSTSWGIYVSQSGAGKSLADGTACTDFADATGHHFRFRISDTADRSFVWENSSETCLMDLEGSTGNLTILGDFSLRSSKELRFYDNGNYVGFEAPALDADQIWVLPTADALQAGSPLVSDAGGNLSWGGDVDLGAGNFITTGTLGAGQTTLAKATLGDDGRGLSSIFTLSANPAKSDGIAFYSEGHIGAITTDGPTYGAGIWLNIDAGATLGADVRALDIGIYEAGATCVGRNAYGLAIHLEFDDTDPPAAIYPFRINCNDTPGHATPDALIFAPNVSALGLVTGDPGTADDAYLKIKLQDGSVYRIPLVKE